MKGRGGNLWEGAWPGCGGVAWVGVCPSPAPPPRQPLMDNLESQTYEVFEKDPIKYSQYQQVTGRGQGPGGRGHCLAPPTSSPYFPTLPQAIYKCLLDRVPEEEKDTNVQ